MTAAEFVAELERRGKWEVEVAYGSADASSATWRCRPVLSVSRDGFDYVEGKVRWEKEGEYWRFPEKPRPDFLTWLKTRQRKDQGHDRDWHCIQIAIDDYEAGREP